jgi:hypothetical protein
MATKQQIPVLAARLVEFQDEFYILSTDDAQWTIMNGREAAKLAANAIANRPKTKDKPLAQADFTILNDSMSVLSVSATATNFVAKDYFVVDTSQDAKVKISHLGYAFIKRFLGKVEKPFSGSTVSVRSLKKRLVDGSILAALGGKKLAETSLIEFYAVIAAQPYGEMGSLSSNSLNLENIFYIKDVNDILCAVSVIWFNDGWNIEAHHIKNTGKWKAGCRVFFRSFFESKRT